MLEIFSHDPFPLMYSIVANGSGHGTFMGLAVTIRRFSPVCHPCGSFEPPGLDLILSGFLR